MSVSDPIADMLTRIRNASRAGLEMVSVSHSSMKSEIARILKREGYIADFITEGHDHKKNLQLYLKYDFARKPVIQGLRRISKPGLRRYVDLDKLPRVLNGMGIAVLSTSSGVVSDKEARKLHVGGEVLCYVW